MKKLFLFAAIITFIVGCSKKTEVIELESSEINELKTSNEKSCNHVNFSDFNYIYNGKSVKQNDLDWSDDNLNVFYGFDNTKNAYVFYSEKEIIDWVQKTKHSKNVIKTLKDIEKAKQYAIEIGEFEKEETSKEFDDYMRNNFHVRGGLKGTGWFSHNTGWTGDDFMIFPWPKKRLRSRDDDEAESMHFFGNYIRMYSKKKWKGSSLWYVTPNVIWIESFGSFNNELSSYWTW